MSDKLKPALIVGAGLGLFFIIDIVLSRFVSFAGCCNCLWPVVAGVVATMLYVKGSQVPASPGDGAIIGALTGLIGGLIYLIIGLPLSYFWIGVAAAEMQLRQLNPNFPLTGALLLVIGGIIGSIVFVVLTTLGGLLGVPIFEKRKGNSPPPPPTPGVDGGYTV